MFYKGFVGSLPSIDVMIEDWIHGIGNGERKNLPFDLPLLDEFSDEEFRLLSFNRLDHWTKELHGTQLNEEKSEDNSSLRQKGESSLITCCGVSEKTLVNWKTPSSLMF